MNYNMSEIFKTKVRQVGTSLGILIPKKVTLQEKIRKGEEIEVSLIRTMHKSEVMKAIEELSGIAKGAGPFKRDHKDRIDRYT